MSVKISSLNTASTIDSGDDISIAGNNPLAFSDWGGGWYMMDGTWIRSYNSKSLWMNSGIIGGDGGLTIGYGGTSYGTGNAIIAGLVGIGTSTPNRTLSVNGIIGVASGTANTQQLVFSIDSGASYITSSYFGSSSYVPMYLETGGAIRLAIQTNGNIGIGTTTDAGYKLDVNGTGRFSGALIGTSASFYTPTLNHIGIGQITNTGAIFNIIGSTNLHITNNSYYNSGFLYSTTAASGKIQITGTGSFIYSYAASGTINTAVTYTDVFTVTNAGAATFSSSVTASSLIKSGGTSTQYLMADGSVSTLTNPVTGSGTIGYIPKFTGASALGNSIISEASGTITIDAGGSATIDTRLSLSASGNGGAGRGTAILINVPGLGNNVNGVKINAYTVGGAVVNQSTDLAFDVGLSGTLVERMRINSAGNLGLGITPTVSGGRFIQFGAGAALSTNNTNNSNFWHNTNFDASGNALYAVTGQQSSFYRQINGAHQWFYAAAGTAGNAITFTQHMTLDASGQLLIGTTTSSTFKLDVVGTARVSGNVSFGTSGARPISYDATNGNFKITPSAGGWATGYLFNGSLGTYRGGFGGFGNSDGLTYFWIGSDYNTAALYVNPSTNCVGINTSTPIYKLNVVTDAIAGRQTLTNINRTAQNLVTFTNPQYSVDASMGIMLRVFPQSDARQGAGIIASGGGLNGDTDLDLFVSTGTTSSVSYSALKIKSNGLVGIGTTTPNAPLDVTSATTSSSAIQQWSYSSNPSNYRLQLNTIVTSGLVKYSFDMLNAGTAYNNTLVLTNGNVLIGTATDSGYKLDVIGNGRVNGSLTFAQAFGTNQFINGTGDGASFATYNFALSGWSSMAFYNPTVGGAYPEQVSGLIDFRNGIINMKGGFSVNGSVVLYAGNYNTYAPTLTGTGASGTWGISITGNANYATTAGALTSMNISQFTNNSGYITSASLAGYLPLTGGTLTGDLTTSGWFINSTDTYGIQNSANGSSFYSSYGGWSIDSTNPDNVGLVFYAPVFSSSTEKLRIGWNSTVGIFIQNDQGADASIVINQGAGYGGYLEGSWNVTNILTVAGNYAKINKDYVYDSGYIEYYSSFATTPSTKPWRAGVFSSGDVEIGTIFQIKFPNSTATQFQVFEYGQVAIGGDWLYINEGGTSNACNINFGGGTIGATNSWRIRTGSGFGGYNLLNNATTLYTVSTTGTHSFYSSTPTLLAQFSSTAATFSTTIVATNGDILGGSTTSDTGSLTLRGGYGTTAANAAKIQIRGFESGAATQGALMFFTNNTERFRISQTGAAVFFGSVGVTSNYLSVGAYGLTSDTYSAYFRRNDTSNYSAWDITGAKGGYVGAFYNTPNLPHMMFSSTDGNGGLFYQTAGRWITYYHYVNNCLSINGATSSASYRLYVNGDSRIVGTFNVSTLTTNGIVYSNGGNLTNTNPSDLRLKEDINPLQYGLKEVMALNPVTYKWKDGSNGGQRSTGLIAQDVKEIMPDYVKNVSEDSDLLGLDSYAINIVLINAIKELQAKIEILENNK
jgi:hypothetical protein